MDRRKVSIDSDTFKFLYGKYKEFVIPLIVVLVCTVVLITVISPQFQNVLDLSRKLEDSKKNLDILKKNFDVLSSLDEAALNSQLKILSLALPGSQDFIGIINAITYASSVSGVGIGAFQLSVGELSQDQTSVSDSSSSSVSLTVNGDIEEVNRFISILATTLPLSEVTTGNVGDFSSGITVNFHHKPFPSTKEKDISPIVSVSGDDLTLINELSNFNYLAFYEFESGLKEGTPSSDLSEDF